MRQLTSHPNLTGRGAQVNALDDSETDGACYRYDFTGLDLSNNSAYYDGMKPLSHQRLSVILHTGPFGPVGVENGLGAGVANGVTPEALLTVCQQHMQEKQRAVQAGVIESSVPVSAQAKALELIEKALNELNKAAQRRNQHSTGFMATVAPAAA